MDEVIEQIPAVVRSRRRFGVILNRKGGPVLQPDAFDRIVIQIDMRDLDVGSLPDCPGIDAEAVILRRDLTTPSNKVLYRMVEPPMAVMHLEGWNVVGEGQKLVSEANAEQWLFLP